MNKTVEISRLMSPDDANIAGNVHGGNVLKMIEDAGLIIASRHCNSVKTDPSQKIWAALVRVEHTDFLQPLFIGEVATVDAEITYASKRSLEVCCTVWVENLMQGTKRNTNRAFLWYVAVDIEQSKTVEVPPIEYSSKEKEEEGKKRYEAQKKSREKKIELHEDEKSSNGGLGKLRIRSEDAPMGTVRNSISSLIHIVHPSDCDKFGLASGGFTMKTMDTVAGIVAFRHCKTNVVTACIDAVDFHFPIQLGYIVTFTGRVVFSSNRSLEIEVLVDAEVVEEERHFLACSALFTFVSLDQNQKVLRVPPLVIENEEEQKRYDAGLKRYQVKKTERMATKNT